MSKPNGPGAMPGPNPIGRVAATFVNAFNINMEADFTRLSSLDVMGEEGYVRGVIVVPTEKIIELAQSLLKGKAQLDAKAKIVIPDGVSP